MNKLFYLKKKIPHHIISFLYLISNLIHTQFDFLIYQFTTNNFLYCVDIFKNSILLTYLYYL
jgi:hypothetical protein